MGLLLDSIESSKFLGIAATYTGSHLLQLMAGEVLSMYPIWGCLSRDNLAGRRGKGCKDYAMLKYFNNRLLFVKIF